MKLILPRLATTTALVVSALSIINSPSSAAEKDFDRRQPAAATGEWSSQQKAAFDELREQNPLIQARRAPLTGFIDSLASTEGFLEPAGGELKVSERDNATVQRFVTRAAPLLGYSSDAFRFTRVKREHVWPKSGIKSVVWEQLVAGVPVFEGEVKAVFNPAGELIVLNGSLVSSEISEQTAQSVPAASIDARGAIERAARSLGLDVAAKEILEAETPVPGAVGRFKAPQLTSADAQKVWLRSSTGTLQLCWQVIAESGVDLEAYRLIVNANTGEIEVRHSLTANQAQATYTVFADESPTPFVSGLTGTTQPPTIARTQITLRALSATASPDGWVSGMDDPNATHGSVGNNALAFLDRNGNENVDTISDFAVAGTGINFTFPLNLSLEPSNLDNGHSAVTNAFYWVNWMHDRLYDFGFTETAGNFQALNFGRGGQEGDRVVVQVQARAGLAESATTRNNAQFFSTVSDGIAPKMKLFVFSGPTPDRDSGFDAEVILHEYSHGLSNRLVGSGSGTITTEQGRGLGEGWSDFLAEALLATASDDLDEINPNGGYVSYLLGYDSGHSGFQSNYVFGGRRYPYAFDLLRNPLRFFNLRVSPVTYYNSSSTPLSLSTTPTEVHNAGEIWCSALMDVRRHLIDKHGFAIGNELAIELCILGMDLTPANPNFIQARDAILQADAAANGGANSRELWNGFARRGMGPNAEPPDDGYTLMNLLKSSYVGVAGVSDGGGQAEDGVLASVVDPQGNSYTVGFKTSATTGKDVLIKSFSASGTLRWSAVWAGSTGNKLDEAKAVHFRDGFLYVAVEASNNAGTDGDFVALKVDASNGGFSSTWPDLGDGPGARRFQPAVNGFERPTAMALNTAGDIFITGDANSGFLTVKFASNGAIQWNIAYKPTGNPSFSNATAIAVFGTSVYVTGQSFINSTDTYDYATVRYTDGATATQNWARRFDGANSADRPKYIAADSTGVWVTGTSIKNDAPYTDVLTLNYNNAGTLRWQKRYDYAGSSLEDVAGLTIAGGNAFVLVTRLIGGSLPGDAIVLLNYTSTGALSTSWPTSGEGAGIRVLSADDPMFPAPIQAIALASMNDVNVQGTPGGIYCLYHHGWPMLVKVGASNGDIEVVEALDQGLPSHGSLLATTLALGASGHVHVGGLAPRSLSPGDNDVVSVIAYPMPD